MSTIDSPIFVVDDDASVREALGSLIRSAGWRVETFATAQEFLARPRAEGPSCLVLDVQLPGLSGLDLQQELAKMEVQIPIIFLTGHGDIPMSVRAIKAGALEFLTKPVDDEALLEAIQRGLAQDQSARQQQTNGASHSGEERNGTSAAGRAGQKQGEGVGAASAHSLPSTVSPTRQFSAKRVNTGRSGTQAQYFDLRIVKAWRTSRSCCARRGGTSMHSTWPAAAQQAVRWRETLAPRSC